MRRSIESKIILVIPTGEELTNETSLSALTQREINALVHVYRALAALHLAEDIFCFPHGSCRPHAVKQQGGLIDEQAGLWARGPGRTVS